MKLNLLILLSFTLLAAFAPLGIGAQSSIIPAATTVKTYLINHKGWTIGKHRVEISVTDCGGGKHKITASKRTLIEMADPYYYFWNAGSATGFGAKPCAQTHTMTSVGTLVSTLEPDWRSSVACVVSGSPGTVTCSHAVTQI